VLGAETLFKAALVFAMLALTVLDRFGARVTPDFSVPPALIAMYGLVLVLFVAGAGTVQRAGAASYCLVVGVASLSYLLNSMLDLQSQASGTALLLIAVLYAPFAVSLRDNDIAPRLWRWTMELYIGFAVLVGIAGIAQFFMQFLWQPEWLFDYTPMLPESVRASGGWNTVYPVAGWIKSNGFFLREPSIFSVAMALGLLCEASLRRRRWILALLGLAIFLSYSGSGLLCLGAALLFPLRRRSIIVAVAVVAVLVPVYLYLGDALNLTYTVERVDEINNERSSAYCRFVYPGAAALEHMDANGWTSVLGNGPGTMSRMGGTCPDGTQTTYGKLLFEYGLAGVVAFGFLIIAALNRAGAPLRLRVGLGVTWLLLGGKLASSEILLTIYLLSALWPKRAASG
jgi:hypothetical protein